jgi:hypothetical protein
MQSLQIYEDIIERKSRHINAFKNAVGSTVTAPRRSVGFKRNPGLSKLQRTIGMIVLFSNATRAQ